MSQDFSTVGFTEVDKATNPLNLIDILDNQHAMTFHQAYKHRTFAALEIKPGKQVLDVGCGTGKDVLDMAQLVGESGHVTGVDASQTMIDEAVKRSQNSSLPIDFQQADGRQLPFADHSFDCCRADRIFQHLTEPKVVLAEMLRVTKPGGKLLIVDGDHETRVIDTPYKDVTRRFLAFRSDTLQRGSIAHQLFAVFKEYSLVDVIVEPMTQITTNYEEINSTMHFDDGIRLAQQYGVVTQEEADKWIAYVEEAAHKGYFFHSVTFFITTGRKPF